MLTWPGSRWRGEVHVPPWHPRRRRPQPAGRFIRRRAERNAGRLTGRGRVELRKKVFGIYGDLRCAALKDGCRCDVVLGLQVHHTNDLDDNSIQSLVPALPLSATASSSTHRDGASFDPPMPLIR